LTARLDAACEQERELVLSPAFFQRLRARWPRLTRVEARPKPGSDENELTRFRYDVVLGTGETDVPAPTEYGTDPPPSRAELAAAACSAPIRLMGLPNERLAPFAAALDALARADPDAPLSEIRAHDPDREDALDMVELREWAEAHGLVCDLRSSSRGADRFDLVLRQADGPSPADPPTADDGGPVSNAPLAASLARDVERELRADLAALLPEAMIPASLTALSALPHTAHGKVDRKRLPRPTQMRPNLVKAFEAPVGPVEQTLARLWSDLLRVERVGRHDDFFQLGGDSIVAIQFVSRARAAGLILKPGDTFRLHTIAALAQACASPAAEATASCGDCPLTPAQVALLQEGAGDRNHCNQAILLSARGPLEPLLVERALAAVHAHHEGLRIAAPEGSDRAFVTDIAPPVLERLTGGRRSVASRLAQMQAGLDVARGKLWRAGWLEDDADASPGLVLVAHHIAVDQASWQIILDDLETAYRALVPLVGGRDISSLRRCISAGEALPKATSDAWYDATGMRIIDGIGATEMIHIFISAKGEDIRPGATGKPLPGYQACVLDDQGRPLSRPNAGRLAVKGPSGCRYLDDPRQLEYVQNGWNVTGDRYYIDEDGYFWFQARADDMIISGGYNIAGPEVEAALLQHPAVRECAVVGARDEQRGQIVKAYVVANAGHVAGDALARELQEHVKRAIAPYKYPRAVEFLSELPKTPTGKLQRYVLRERASS